MTEKQRKLLLYIKEYYAATGASPTLADLENFDGTSRQNVTEQLKKLAIKGYLNYLRAGVFIPTKKKVPVDNVIA